MDRPARLPVDCPRCENRGVVPLDDDRTIACPLCNNWCTLCLDGVPTFVPITRPFRGSLIAGMRPNADGETLFEGYVCDYHKVTLRSYSSIAPAMIGRYQADQAYSRRRGASSWCATHMGRRRLATVQKMVGHESVTTTAGYDRRGDAAKRKAADLVHVSFFPRQT